MRGRGTAADWRIPKRRRKFAAANGRAKTLRREMTPTEREVWAVLRTMEGLPGRFRRQAPIGPYVADFVCHALKLVVEIDGGIHRLDGVAKRDEKRDAWLMAEGYKVIRVTNDDARNATLLASLVPGAAPHP